MAFDGSKSEKMAQKAEEFKALMLNMTAEAERRMQLRGPVEQRWLEDLRQYYGQYDEQTIKEIKANGGSELFINQTRPKTNALIARLFDLLCPTDDVAWSIEPTPVPEIRTKKKRLQGELYRADQLIKSRTQMGQKANSDAVRLNAETELQDLEVAKSQVEDALAELALTEDEARITCDLMFDEISDQYSECGYNAEFRDHIEDMCKLGTGVMKGPITGLKSASSFIKAEKLSDSDADVWELKPSGGIDMEYVRVDPWSYYPDPDVIKPNDSDLIYELHLLTPKQMRKLARNENFDSSAIARILSAAPNTQLPSYMSQLALVGAPEFNKDLTEKRYQIWEVTGSLSLDQAMLFAEAIGNEEFIQAYNDETEEAALAEVNIRMMFGEGEIIFIEEHPLDSGEQLYSCVNLEKAELSPYGYGLPYLIRDPQAAHSAAWRAMMDNSSAAAGPQIVINKRVIKPEDNVYELQPFKIWLRDGTSNSSYRDDPFQVFNITSNQGEFAAILELSRRLIDEMASMPAIAEGEQGAGVTKTFQGMAMLMNSANVVFRRVVKNIDDDIIIPNTSRAYQWNMQFNERPEIKGDMRVTARGSSVLLVREILSQNLMMLAQVFADHPKFGPMMDEYELFKHVIKSNQLPAKDIMLSRADWEKAVSEQQDPGMIELQEQQRQFDEKMAFEREKLDADVDKINATNASREQIAELQFQIGMDRLAKDIGIDRDTLDQKWRMFQSEMAQKDRSLAAEIAMKQRTGDSAGGSV